MDLSLTFGFIIGEDDIGPGSSTRTSIKHTVEIRECEQLNQY